MGRVKVEPEFEEVYDFEANGGILHGTYEGPGAEFNVGSRVTFKHKFVLADGTKTTLWSSTMLDASLHQVDLGSPVEIEHDGTKRGRMLVYDVYEVS